MTTTPFEHCPLDAAKPLAIQILDLLPSCTLKGPIHCELRHHSLDEDVPYEAVSYAWGDPEPGYTVFVNGSHTLEVTPNCLDVLISLRRRFHRRTLWIDAICIDQRDVGTSKRERDRQVKIMGDIYRKAQKVLIWLGPGQPSTARTIARLKLIAKVEAAAKRAGLKFDFLWTLENYLVRRTINETGPCISTPRPRYQAFESMICSPWWQRVWTLQEQALARQCEAHQGRQSISILFLQAGSLLTTIEYLTNGDGYHNHLARFQIHAFCQSYNTFPTGLLDQYHLQSNDDFFARNLLEMAFLLQAKNPIDKIYGLYSILTDYCNLPLSAPDYKKTAEEVYEETVWAWINTRGDLSILKLAGRPNSVHKLPSWVPAWHQKHPSLIRNVCHTYTPERFEAFSNSHFNWYRGRNPLLSGTLSEISRNTEDPVSVASLLPHGRLRVVRARFVGKVSHAIGTDRSNEYGWYCDSSEGLYVHLDWCRIVHHIFFKSIAKLEEAIYEMFRLLDRPGIHQSDFGDRSLKKFESFRAWFNFMLYLNRASGPASMVWDMADTEHNQAQVNFYHDVCMAAQEEEVMNVLKNRYAGIFQGREGLTKLAGHVRSTRRSLAYVRNHRLCILDNDNMIAITDYWCHEGDEVFIFPGTDSPFVLRREPDGDCYRLVGPALVDRLLRVGYQEWRSEGDDLQDIVLI